MKLEEAIVYLLASSNQGMKTDQIAREINERGLYQRWDKEPVSNDSSPYFYFTFVQKTWLLPVNAIPVIVPLDDECIIRVSSVNTSTIELLLFPSS